MGRLGDRGEMEAFVRSVDLGGFSAAARELKLTPSALSKLVSRLERTLRTRLLYRSTRRLAPTPEGELFLVHCRKILAQIEEAEGQIGLARDHPRGRLRIHVGAGFALHQLAPALPRFVERYPDIQVELIVEDRQLDFIKEGLDLAVRPGPFSDSTLVARKVCEFRRVVCAAPEYLARHGFPRVPEDLAQHKCITFADAPALAKWSFESASGASVVDVSSAIGANNAECVLQFALLGIGIACLNDFIVSDCIRTGRLIRILEDSQTRESLSMMALYSRARQGLPRIAAMLDFLKDVRS